MGTNFYLRRKEPERYTARLGDIVDWRHEQLLADPDMEIEMLDHKAVHIAKTSYGWVPSFQAVPASMPFDETEMNNDLYRIGSVADIKGYMDTGDYEIIDEEGDVYDWAGFDNRVLRWCDMQRGSGYKGEFSNHTDVEDSLGAYKDPEGYQFCRTCFC